MEELTGLIFKDHGPYKNAMADLHRTFRERPQLYLRRYDETCPAHISSNLGAAMVSY